MSAPIRAWSATHPGAVRPQNQDACLSRPEIGLFAVADGVGGQGGGEIAAARVMEMLSRVEDGLAPAARLAAVRAGLQDTHRALRAMATRPDAAAAPATTIVALLVHEDHFACLWAGDSRAYLLRDGTLHRLTTDHSVVQDLVDAGALTEAQAAGDPRQNIITRALGAGVDTLAIAKLVGETQPGDRFLLCSDGLHKTLQGETIALALMGEAADPAARLVGLALEEAARDNVTAVVVIP